MFKKNILKNLSFKTKLFISMEIIFLTLILMTCFLFSKNAIKTARKSEQASANMVLERVSTQINSLYEQMNIAATYITKNPALKSIVLELNSSDNNEPEEQFYQLRQERTIHTALGNMMFSPIISNVHLYNQEKQYFYYSGFYYDDLDYIQKALSSDTATEELNDKNVLYLPPMTNRWTPEDRKVISVQRSFSDTDATKNTIVEVQVSFQLIEDICTQDAFHGEKEFLILDSQGNIVYPLTNTKVVSSKVINSICQKIKKGETTHWEYDYSYSSEKSPSTKFTTVLISNNQTMRQQTILYIVTTIITALIVLSVTLAITYLLITRVTNPLKQLIEHINELRLDSDIQFLLPSDTFNEFDILNTSLNKMVKKLKASIKENYELQIRESNANLAALQAQIDPHFLYNALNSISAASEIYDSEVTTQMCQKLSSMMRYVTSKKSSVTFIEEISHTKNFLDFMKISYDSNFDYELTIPQKIHNLVIPKLSIQPFVENSFRHGFKNTLPPWHLSINCTVTDQNWKIQIIDNGEGFSKEALTEIASSPVNATNLEINGLGLNNTFSRLALLLGKNFSYQIENLSPGSCITLKGVFK